MSLDPYFDDVVLLLGFESGTAVDESPLAQTVTLAGETAAVTAAQAKFGTYSYTQDMDAEWDEVLSVPDHAAFALGADPFTIEGWFRLNDPAEYSLFLSHSIYGHISVQDIAWRLNYYAGELQFLITEDGTSGVYPLTSATALTAATWYHIAVDWDGTTYRLYLDGVMLDSSTTPYTINDITGPIVVGGETYDTGSGLSPTPYFAGYADEIRITAGVARYADDGGFTVPAAAFPRAGGAVEVVEGLRTVGSMGVALNAGGTEWGELVINGVALADILDPVISATIAEALGLGDVIQSTLALTIVESLGAIQIVGVVRAMPASVTEGLGAADVLVVWEAPVVREALRLSATAPLNWNTIASLTEALELLDTTQISLPVLVTEGLGVSDVLIAAQAVLVAEALGLTAALSRTASSNVSVVEAVELGSSLALFLGAGVTEGLGLAVNLTGLSKSIVAVTEGLGVAETMTPTFMMRVTLSEGLDLSADVLLGGIYNGTITENLQLTLGYLAPDGSFSTWVMNTRTGAVSEYDNYEFNSFARIDNKYVGASASGLYELLGDDDAGTDIISVLEGGFLQFGGTKQSRLKAAYIAVHGEDNQDMVLKIETHDGQTYTYTTNMRDGRSSRVHMGKGQRARYFSWTLTSTGPDFNLDTLEFVPLVVQRRV